MPIAPRMNQPVGPYDFWRDTLQPGLFGLYDRWTEQKPWPTPEQINAAVQNPGLLDRDAMAGYAVDMAQPFAAKLGGLLGHMPVPEGGLFGITTWHGSPHKWTKPDISKVGTGEGAQAYGHGFYSAERKDVGEAYKDNVKDIKSALTFDGKTIDQIKDSVSPEAFKIAKTLNGQFYSGTPIDEMLRRPWVKQYLNELGPLKSSDGYLYKLDIPDEDVAKYLDWDKPLSEQPHVQKALLNENQDWIAYANSLDSDSKKLAEDMILGRKPNLGDDSTAYWKELYKRNPDIDHNVIHDIADELNPSQSESEWLWGVLNGNASPGSGVMGGEGSHLYNRLGSAQEAALRLQQMGIPGIRYLDGSSRSAGEGTYNYVTFDPSRIKVLERNGEDLRGLFGR